MSDDLRRLWGPDFLWGCATAALQIEGASQLRESTWWDDFCRDHPERIFGGATPEPACDHYQRYQEDLDWAQQLGHNAYRFSISWPRGKAGLDFYDRLVDGCLARGIQPLATLYHWDLPSRLESWENPAAAEELADFAQICAQRLGDRISHWMTLNEPGWSLMNGYVTGLHPPQVQDLGRAFSAAHQQMRAHHLCLAALRQNGAKGKMGLALNLSPVTPLTRSAKDLRAARWAEDYLNQWFLQAALLGRYPERAARLLERTRTFSALSLPPAQSCDFLGVNYYYPKWARHSRGPDGFALNTSGDGQASCHFCLQGKLEFASPPGRAKTEWDWDIDAPGLERLLLQLSHQFPGLPLLVTENGLGRREAWGDFHDPERIEFVAAHLQAIARARTQSADVRGYLMWSLMDNFSWLNGYTKRYGLLAIHPETLQRHPKSSAHWLRQIIVQEREL
jgi:beta-glucosidase/6-phospho-beta-glucosidase/beta-galactosidase